MGVAAFTVSDTCDPNAGQTRWAVVTSDEATASEPGAGGSEHCPDARLVVVRQDGLVDPSSTSLPGEMNLLQIRAERAGPDGTDNGRVYGVVGVSASDRSGNVGTGFLPVGAVRGCPGAVCVPHDEGGKSGNRCLAIDDGQTHDATVCD